MQHIISQNEFSPAFISQVLDFQEEYQQVLTKNDLHIMVLKYSQLTNVLQLQSDTKICDITAHEFMAKQDVFLPAVLG